jgi:hypothetical protein
MKRIGIVGLCLVAMFAFSAMAVSLAQAGQVGICARVAKSGKVYKGKYIGKNCMKKASSAEVENGGRANKYEWMSAAGHKYTAKGPWAHLRMPGYTLAAEVACRWSTGEGEWTGPTTGVDTIVFKLCTLNVTGGECTSEGLSPGEIETSPLDVTLVSYPETRVQETDEGPYEVGPAEGKAWVEYSAAPGHPYAEYVCEPGVMFRTLGTVAGLAISPFDVMRRQIRTSFGPGQGVQDLYSEFSDNGGISYESTGLNSESSVSSAKGVGKAEIKP